MNVLPPRIRAVVSECCAHLWLRGQFPGATVEVHDVDAGSVVASEVAGSSDQVIAVTGALVPGHRLAAKQVLGSDDSGLAAESVTVQVVPGDIGAPVFAEPVFQCAECLWIDGLVPGADVVVRQSGAEIGTGHSHIGYARVHLSTPLSNHAVEVTSEACGSTGDARSVVPLPAPAGERQGNVLGPPTVEAPLQECRNRVTISDVIPGATVELERSSGPSGAVCFDRPSLWWGMNPPLALGETIRARQLFLNCEKFSLWSDPVPVEPLQPVPAPTVVGPLCHKGSTVRVCGLLAGAHVRITVAPSGHHGRFGGTVYEAVAPEDGCFDFVLAEPGLPAGSIVFATQELCGRVSERSSEIPVDDQPEELPRPSVADPLHECAIVVRVTDLAPGTRVYVVADGIGVIGEAHVTDDEMGVTVRPALQAGWEITAYAVGCGHESQRAEAVVVQRQPELEPPTIPEPVHSCDRDVLVTGLVPGAAVDLYVNGDWIGRAHAGDTEVEVPVEVGALAVGDQVHAVQSLCEDKSRPSRTVRVTRFDGEWEVLSDADGDPLTDKSEILAVHVALLPTGRILIFAGDQYTSDGQPIDNTRLMDAGPPWQLDTITGIAEGYNLFCAGHAMLADGTLVTGGGTESRPPAGHHGAIDRTRGHWLGIRGSLRFRPDSSGTWGWEEQGDLVPARPGDVRPGFDRAETGGRWYPTLCTLPDGQVVAIGGHPLDGDVRHTSTSLELYDPATGDWTIVGSADYDNIPGEFEAGSRGRHSEYPRMHVLPNGKLFVASVMADGDVHAWEPGNDAQNWTKIAGSPACDSRNDYCANPQPYTSVLLPLRHDTGFTPQVLLLGGQNTYTIRPQAAAPTWTARPRTYPGQPPRIYPLATLLPTGEVFVSGGTSTTNDTDALLEPEIYDPASSSWRTVDAAASRVRNYHSSALLLPDGSVWHSGGNEDCRSGLDTQDRTVEIYRPWYFCWPRPRIGEVGLRACHGGSFAIETPDAARIEEVVIVRLGSFTHAFNPDQRHISLEFTRDNEDSTVLRALVPEAPGIAVVGYYLCFILDADRVPSVGRFIQVCTAGGSAAGTAPDGGEGERDDGSTEWADRLAQLLEDLWPQPKGIDPERLRKLLQR